MKFFEKILIKLFSQDWYCRMFHMGVEIDKHNWSCSECDIIVKKSKLDRHFFK